MKLDIVHYMQGECIITDSSWRYFLWYRFKLKPLLIMTSTTWSEEQQHFYFQHIVTLQYIFLFSVLHRHTWIFLYKDFVTISLLFYLTRAMSYLVYQNIWLAGQKMLPQACVHSLVIKICHRYATGSETEEEEGKESRSSVVYFSKTISCLKCLYYSLNFFPPKC